MCPNLRRINWIIAIVTPWPQRRFFTLRAFELSQALPLCQGKSISSTAQRADTRMSFSARPGLGLLLISIFSQQHWIQGHAEEQNKPLNRKCFEVCEFNSISWFALYPSFIYFTIHYALEIINNSWETLKSSLCSCHIKHLKTQNSGSLIETWTVCRLEPKTMEDSCASLSGEDACRLSLDIGSVSWGT